MKTLFCLLLSLGFLATYAWGADDDDEWEWVEEGEEESPKKAAKKAKSESGSGRIGFAVGFDGSLDKNRISFVYDLGNGIEVGMGLGFSRYQWTPYDGEPPDPEQSVAIVPSLSYKLGTGLLDYGVGVDVGIVLEPVSNRKTEGGTGYYGNLYLFTSAELVKNVSLKLSAGVNVDKPAEYPEGSGTGITGQHYPFGNEMTIRLMTSGQVVFYFL